MLIFLSINEDNYYFLTQKKNHIMFSQKVNLSTNEINANMNISKIKFNEKKFMKITLYNKCLSFAIENNNNNNEPKDTRSGTLAVKGLGNEHFGNTQKKKPLFLSKDKKDFIEQTPGMYNTVLEENSELFDIFDIDPQDLEDFFIIPFSSYIGIEDIHKLGIFDDKVQEDNNIDVDDLDVNNFLFYYDYNKYRKEGTEDMIDYSNIIEILKKEGNNQISRGILLPKYTCNIINNLLVMDVMTSKFFDNELVDNICFVGRVDKPWLIDRLDIYVENNNYIEYMNKIKKYEYALLTLIAAKIKNETPITEMCFIDYEKSNFSMSIDDLSMSKSVLQVYNNTKKSESRYLNLLILDCKKEIKELEEAEDSLPIDKKKIHELKMTIKNCEKTIERINDEMKNQDDVNLLKFNEMCLINGMNSKKECPSCEEPRLKQEFDDENEQEQCLYCEQDITPEMHEIFVRNRMIITNMIKTKSKNKI